MLLHLLERFSGYTLPALRAESAELLRLVAIEKRGQRKEAGT